MEHICASSQPVPLGLSNRVCDTCGGPTMNYQEKQEVVPEKKATKKSEKLTEE